jgi:hypothetical protein
MPMKKSQLFFILVLAIASCESDENGLSPCAEIERLDVLNRPKDGLTTIQSGRGFYDLLLYQAHYKGNTVFIERVCCPSCNTLPPEVRDITGRKIGYLGVDIPYEILESGVVICRTHNGVC